ARHRLSDASVGYVLYELAGGRTLAARNEHAPFIPASTAKVATTVAALNILGPDYRFETRVLATGEVEDGVLKGNLYLQGTGDPLLQPQDLLGLAQRLRDLGVTAVEGGFHYDASFLKTTARIDAGQPESAGYNPGVGALSLDFNQTLLSWRRGAEPGTARAFETPAFDEAGPGLGDTDPGPGRHLVHVGPVGASRWLLSPMAPAEGAQFLPVKRPGLRTARVFRRLAKLVGVTLPEPTAAPAPGDARPLARVGSLALVDVVRQALEHSNNMVAELIGQVAARRLTGEAAGLADGANALAGWLKAQLADVSWEGFRLVNHSGLSSAARASPAQMAAIVRFAAGQRYGGWSYPALLPAAGMRDALGGRFHDPATALRVWAKTGTLKYAKGLAGLLHTQQDRRLAFALYVTDFAKRRVYDEATNVQAPDVVAAADEWIARAEAFEEDLVREWILQF
ncbi:MAG: D-alanyl-D-alanine carboxypeptidase/D-alanyl-D-alanine-endopeptidase, partial [Rhodospirillales bacterium]